MFVNIICSPLSPIGKFTMNSHVSPAQYLTPCYSTSSTADRGKEVANTDVFLLLATAKAKAVRSCRVSNDRNCFDLLTLVQTLHTLQTTTDSIIVWLCFTLFTFSVARSDKTSVTRPSTGVSEMI